MEAAVSFEADQLINGSTTCTGHMEAAMNFARRINRSTDQPINGI